MARPKCAWIGKSKKEYSYGVFKLPVKFPQELGNYIFTKKNIQNRWVPIYIGEGDLYERVSSGNHHQQNCIDSKGATHVHAHLTDDKKASVSEEADLLGHYTNAYKPNGCNEKEGG